MSTLYEALHEQIAVIDRSMSLPAIHSFTFPPLTDSDGRQNNFAYLTLTDGSIGLTYVALDNALEDLHSGQGVLPIAGQSPAELAKLYRNSQGWERALGLSAINAISQHVMSHSDCLNDMPDNVQLLSPEPHERIGMVGYFGRVVEPLRSLGISVTVVELEESLLRQEPGLEVTQDASRLKGCSQVVITGTTLLNHTLEGLLEYCRDAREVHLLGPSASCLPDVLFAAGITRIGGFRVVSPALFEQRWAARGRWRDAGQRYMLSRRNYPAPSPR